MRIVLATRNPGKLREMQSLFADTAMQLESQAEHEVASPEEDGLTFLENALIKARAVAQATGLPAIADDSGLVVPALKGAPGIYSARYAGTQGDDAANNNKLLASLDQVEDRRAYFFCAMVFMQHGLDPTPITATGIWQGSILRTPRGTQGFGYDPLFLVEGLSQTSAELDPAEKNKRSHRGQASASLLSRMLQFQTPPLIQPG